VITVVYFLLVLKFQLLWPIGGDFVPMWDIVIFGYFLVVFVMDVEKKVILYPSVIFGISLMSLLAYYFGGMVGIMGALAAGSILAGVFLFFSLTWNYMATFIQRILAVKRKKVATSIHGIDTAFAFVIGLYSGMPEIIWVIVGYFFITPILFTIYAHKGLVDKIMPQAPILISLAVVVRVIFIAFSF
jgi:hypothetical protein